SSRPKIRPRERVEGLGASLPPVRANICADNTKCSSDWKLTSGKVCTTEIDELIGTVGEAGEGTAAGAMGKVELVLAQAVAGAHGIDRHPHLHPVAAGKGQRGAQDLGAQRALAGDRRVRLEAAAAADRPAGEAERQAEAAADTAAEGGDGKIALAAL